MIDGVPTSFGAHRDADDEDDEDDRQGAEQDQQLPPPVQGGDPQEPALVLHPSDNSFYCKKKLKICNK